MELLFATGNQHKVFEVVQLLDQLQLPEPYTIKTLSEVGFSDPIPETADTFLGNASIKAKTVYDRVGVPCFSEDSGLVVPSINGEPGVFSARYAGEGKSDRENYLMLLARLKGMDDREAYFHASIVFYDGVELHHFEGQVHGEIVHEPQGLDGFGYDPIFKPHGFDQTFAMMGSGEKSQISHRSQALMKLISFLAEYGREHRRSIRK